MKHIVLFSGGAASSALAIAVSKKYFNNTILLHTPTYSEDLDSDRFRNQVAAYIGLKITEQADGRNVWDLIHDQHALPSFWMPFCTRILKIEQMERYLARLDEDYTVYYGYTSDEWRRVQKISSRSLYINRNVAFPLFDNNISSNACKNGFTKLNIKLPNSYNYLDHNNCIPCFKGGKKHFYNVWKYYPQQFALAIEAEKYTNHTVFKNISLKQLSIEWANGKLPRGLNEPDNRPCECVF